MDQAPRSGKGRPGRDEGSEPREYVAYHLREIVQPNLSPGTYLTYEVIARCYLIPDWAPANWIDYRPATYRRR